MNYGTLAGAMPFVYEKGDCIIHTGEGAEYIYYITEGTCKRIKYSDKGDEIIMTKYRQGDLLCVVMVYSGLPSASEIVANEKVCGYRIPKHSFLDALDHDVAIAKHVIDQVLIEHMSLMQKFRSKQERRSAAFLCQFLLNQAHEKEDGKRIVRKQYNNVEISRYLGIHAVTSARIISALKNEGVIKRTKEGLEITDKEKLTDFAKNKKILKYW